MSLVCLRKNAPTIEDFIRHCGHETALKITNRCHQIAGRIFDIFSSPEFKDLVDQYGMTETFNRIEDAYKKDRLNKLFNLPSLADIEDDTTLIEMQEIKSKAIANRVANAKVIWGHPGIGKTEYYKNNNNNVIDFDSVYKPRINKELGLPEGAEERKKWRREHRDEYRQKILDLFDEAVEDAKKQGKQLLVSDLVVLQERESALDLITQMSEDTFAKRSEQRNEPYDDNKKLWKTDIDESIAKVSDKSKIVNTEKYLSELYEDSNKENNNILADIVYEKEYVEMLNELSLSRDKSENFLYNFMHNVLKVNPKYKVDENSPTFVSDYVNNIPVYTGNLEKLAKKIFGYEVSLNETQSRDTFITSLDSLLDNWSGNLIKNINNLTGLNRLYEEKYNTRQRIELLQRLLDYNLDYSSFNEEEAGVVKGIISEIERATELPITKKAIGYEIQKEKKIYNYILPEKIQRAYYRNLSFQLAAKNRLVALNLIPNLKELVKNRLLAEYDSRVVKPESYEKKIKPYKELYESIQKTINSKYRSSSENSIFPLDERKEISYNELIDTIINSYPEYKNLLKLFRNANPELKIYVGGKPETDDYGRIIAGEFKPDKNILNLTNVADIYTTIHELGHSATYYGIVITSEDFSVFKDKIEDFMNYIRDYVRSVKMSDDYLSYKEFMRMTMEPDVYGFKNPSEFLAELYGNPSFQDMLSKIPAMNSKKFNSLLQEIWSYIVDFLNDLLGKKRIHKTALEQAKELGYAAMRLQQEAIDDIYSQLNELTAESQKLVVTPIGDSTQNNEQTTHIRMNYELQNMLNEEWQKFSKEDERLKEEFRGAQLVYTDEKWLNDHQVSLTDYNVIKQSIVDKVSQQLSMFLYEFDNWAYFHRIEQDSDTYKKLKSISENGALEKLLSIQTFTFNDFFNTAIRQLIRSRGEKKHVFQILNVLEDSIDDKELSNRKSLVSFLKSQVRNSLNSLYNISLSDKNAKSVISIDEFNIEDNLDIHDNDSSNDEAESNITEGDEEAGAQEDFDVIGTMLALKDDLNFDRVKKDKQLIIQLLSGIPNVNKNRISPYGNVNFYNPWNIYNELIKTCHYCKDSDELKERLRKNTRYPYTKQILERMEQSPKFATRIWQTFRGQYRIFYDITVGNDNSYKLTFPNFKYGNTFYRYAILDLIHRNDKNKYFYSIQKADKEFFGFRKMHRDVMLPLVNLLAESYLWISRNYIKPDKNAAFTFKESYEKAEQIKSIINKPLDIKSMGSNAITFLNNLNELLESKEVKDSKQYNNIKINENTSFIDLVRITLEQLDCAELGLDVTDTELTSVFSAFTFDDNSYRYKEEGAVFINKISRALNKPDSDSISSLYDYISRTLDTGNSFVLSNDTSAKLISHFYRGRDGYYSFSDYDKLARHSDWLNSLSNEQYVEWYNQQLENNYYFAAYHESNKFFEDHREEFPEIGGNSSSVHSILYNLYTKAQDSINKGNGASKLIYSSIRQIPNLSHVFFAVQDDKKFSELSEFELIINKISSFLNKSSGTISDTKSLYTSYSLSDKSQSIAFVNERDNNLQLCVNSLAAKTLTEMIRMRNIYRAIADNKKLNEVRKELNLEPIELTFEPDFSAKIDDDYKIDFNENGGIRFAYLPSLNDYLYAINDTNNNEKFSEEEVDFIDNLRTYIYSTDMTEVEQARDNIYFSLVGKEKLQKQTSRIKFARNGIITKLLNAEAKDLEEKILSCNGLVSKLGFKKNTAKNKSAEDSYILKDREGTMKDFNSLNLPTLLKYFVYNSNASLAEQTFIFHDDIVRYGNAKKFTKRANETISKGKEIDKAARDSSGNLYDQRNGEFNGKKVCVTWANVKSNSFIQNGQFYNDIANLMKTQGNATGKSRQNKVDDNKKSILNASIEAADGQSVISLKYKRRYLGQLGRLNPVEEAIIDKLIDVFDTVSKYIEEGKFDKLNEYEKNVIDPLYKTMWKVGYTPSSIKQFASTILNNSDNKRSTATQRKNSEVCVEDIKTLLAQKNYFMIRLMAHMNRNGIDCIDDETTVKEGVKKVFNPSFDGFFEEFDNIISLNDSGNSIFDRDLVNLIPMEDVTLVQDTPAHAMDREDIFGTQVTRIIPSTIDRTNGTKYCLYQFGKNENAVEVTGDWLYNAIQSIFDLRIKNSIKNVKKRFGITAEIEEKLKTNKELTDEELTKLNYALSSVLQGSSKFSNTDYRFMLNPVTGKFIYPVSEFTSTTELSKSIASILKKDIIANNVPGGQLVQVTSTLNELFYRLKNGESKDSPEVKKLLDKSLECKIEYYPDGSLKEVYMQAEIPFMYKDAIDEYITENEQGVLTIDMDKIPEELKHGIFYRIPTEGLCSIFHIKVKRFTYGMADHVKLPAEITKLAGLDFDIDKLFTFIASMKKNKDGKLEYVKPDLENLENNTSKEMLNNALFELMLTALNSPTGINGYNEFGGYDDIKYEGLAITLATAEYKNQKGNDKKSLIDIYKQYKSKSNKELENLFSAFNKAQSPCSVSTNLKIQETNFESKDMLGISANNNALSAELSQLNIYVNTNAFSNGVTIGKSKIISGNKTKFAPKYTVNGNELCSNNIRQPLAASADVGKDAFLGLIGFNKFSIGIWNGLMNLGCEREDALLFLQHPIIQHLSNEFKKEKVISEFPVSPMTIIKTKSILGKSKSKDSSYDDVFLGQDKKIISGEISLDQNFLIESLEMDYKHFIREYPDETASIERLLYFLLKNNREMVTLSPLLKMDSKSNISWNSTFGLIASLANFDLFKNKVIDGYTTFDKSILDIFNNSSNNENSIPRLATILISMPEMVNLILNTQNPHLFNKLKELVFDISKKTGNYLDENDVKDIYDLYNLILISSENSVLAPYFNINTLEERNKLFEEVVKAKTKLLEKYKNNAFLINLETETLPETMLKRYPSLSGYSTLKISMDPSKISASKEEEIKTSLVDLMLNGDEEAIDFVNNVFILSALQSGFNKYSSRSPLRYFNESAISLVINGDYLSYFKNGIYDEASPIQKATYKDFTKFSGIAPNLLDIEDHILASLPHLIKFVSSAKNGEYYRDKDYNINKPVKMADGSVSYFKVSKYGIKGIFMEPVIDKTKLESVFIDNHPDNNNSLQKETVGSEDEDLQDVFDSITDKIKAAKTSLKVTDSPQIKKQC